VSHHEERNEKNCLNCNAEVAGRFCQVCGQENLEPKESFWTLATHFVHDLTHFDGKFFSTLKYLLFKPGYLSQEYLRGKRTSYLHPIRMYVFTSAIFFLIFTNFYKLVDQETTEKKPVAQEIAQLEKTRVKLKSTIAKFDSSSDQDDIKESKTKYEQLAKDIETLKKDSTKRDSIPSLLKEDKEYFNANDLEVDRTTEAQYDSAQHALAPEKRDNIFIQNLKRKAYVVNVKYGYDNKKIKEAAIEKFLHLFPQMLFVSMPLFALILQLLYIRRKQIFYVNHVVFTIHLYCATFILTLSALILNSTLKLVHFPNRFFGLAAYIIVCIYWYKAIRKFYEQTRMKTILKYVILLMLNFFLMLLLFFSFFLLSFFEM
jgi:hypothetical protein